MALYDIPMFDIYEVVGRLLNDNITDVRVNRANKRWIFPTFSDTETNYPNITIKIDSANYEEDSAANYLYEELGNDNIYRIYRYKIATAPLIITILSSKEDGYNVEINGVSYYLKNKMINIYLLEQVKNVLREKRSELLNYFRDINIRGLEMPFDINKRAYASTLNVEIKFKEIWAEEYEDGRLINSYSLNTVTY